MADFDPHPRDSGPAMVTSGPPGAAAILVLDPAGAAKHDDIPASWHPLLWHRQVVWCRLPADGSLEAIDHRLDSFATHGVTVDVLASGPIADLAMVYVGQWAAAVRSLLLVDPAAPDERFATSESPTADMAWEERMRHRIGYLTESGVTVKVIAHSTGDAADRVPPPLPLGHPDVVEAVRSVISELDAASKRHS